jgi:hypothetical protein
MMQIGPLGPFLSSKKMHKEKIAGGMGPTTPPSEQLTGHFLAGSADIAPMGRDLAEID